MHRSWPQGRPSGVPSTGLNDTVINPETAIGVQGPQTTAVSEKIATLRSGQYPVEWMVMHRIEYGLLDAPSVTDQIVYAINQSWGVVISDRTVRAANATFSRAIRTY
jgi:hypothetical protein